MPGALRDFDIPDLARSVAPHKQLWVNPVNALAEPLEEEAMSSIIGYHKGYQFVRTVDTSPENVADVIIQFIQRI